MPIRDFRDLAVWNKSIDLAVDVYELTRQFPREERFGLTSQLRRATTSISTNIAEGSGRGTTRDLVNFLTMSRGSLREAQSLLVLSRRLDFIQQTELERTFGCGDDIVRMLGRLRSNLLALAQKGR